MSNERQQQKVYLSAAARTKLRVDAKARGQEMSEVVEDLIMAADLLPDTEEEQTQKEST